MKLHQKDNAKLTTPNLWWYGTLRNNVNDHRTLIHVELREGEHDAICQTPTLPIGDTVVSLMPRHKIPVGDKHIGPWNVNTIGYDRICAGHYLGSGNFRTEVVTTHTKKQHRISSKTCNNVNIIITAPMGDLLSRADYRNVSRQSIRTPAPITCKYISFNETVRSIDGVQVSSPEGKHKEHVCTCIHTTIDQKSAFDVQV
ncbi:hypothetical protein J3A83DRAFT_955837 [Scleroderma citrinum]